MSAFYWLAYPLMFDDPDVFRKQQPGMLIDHLQMLPVIRSPVAIQINDIR